MGKPHNLNDARAKPLAMDLAMTKKNERMRLYEELLRLVVSRAHRPVKGDIFVTQAIPAALVDRIKAVLAEN